MFWFYHSADSSASGIAANGAQRRSNGLELQPKWHGGLDNGMCVG
jgi:hypothetical protein